jgi:hypothetical protein
VLNASSPAWEKEQPKRTNSLTLRTSQDEKPMKSNESSVTQIRNDLRHATLHTLVRHSQAAELQ